MILRKFLLDDGQIGFKITIVPQSADAYEDLFGFLVFMADGF